MDHNICQDLQKSIEILTTSGRKELDLKEVKNVKNICKKSDEFVEQAYHLLMIQMKKNHAEIRYSTVLIINELFQRSHHFRKLLLTNFEDFLDHSVETDSKKLLPPPKQVAKSLKIKTMEFIQDWHRKYSSGYIRLRLAYEYLKKCKKVDFEDVEQRSAAQRFQEQEERLRKEAFIRTKVKKALEEMEELQGEVENVVTQMESCFNLLVPSFQEPVDSTSEEHKIEEPSGISLRDHGILDNRPYITVTLNFGPKITIVKNDDTQTIIDNMKDFHRQIVKSLLPKVNNLTKVFVKGSQNEDIKKSIDLKQKLQHCLDKFCEIQIDNHILFDPTGFSGSEESEEDELVEVPVKEGFEPIIPPERRKEYGLDPLPSTSATATSSSAVKDLRHDWSISYDPEDVNDPTTRLSNLVALSRKMEASTSSSELRPSCSGSAGTSKMADKKAEMLAKAPKLPFDVDLYHWEEKEIIPPTIMKFDSLHKFWQPISNETTEFVDKEGAAALRQRKIEFTGTFVPVKWSCRAPMPNGKLCPRRDRIKCPFHGPILARDEMGNPTDKSKVPASSKKETVPDWQDPTLLAEIKAATGLDLTLPKKGKRKAKRKFSELTDLKTLNNTSRRRLEKKIFKKSTAERVASTLDQIDERKFDDKFGNQWSYALHN